MKNLRISRLLNAMLVVSATILTPTVIFAQDAATTAPVDNASPAIGFLVIWLLAAGGILAIAAATFADKSAQKTTRTIVTKR